MQITLYQYLGEKIEINKKLDDATITPQKITLDDVYLNDGGNLLYLSITIAYIPNIVIYNYAYIPDFNRYYWVSIDTIANNLWTLNLSVDVMKSHALDILNNVGLIARNQFDYNEYIIDDMIEMNYDKMVDDYAVNQGEYVDTIFYPRQELVNNCIVINCINEDIGLNWDTASADFADESLPVVASTTTGDDLTSTTYLLYPTSMHYLAKEILDDDNLATYINSIITYPFEIQEIGETSIKLKLGKTTLNSVDVETLDKKVSQYLVVGDFVVGKFFNNFMDYEPYSAYEIYLPYLSWVKVNADDVLGDRLIVYYVVNYKDGSAMVTIYNYTKDKIIFTSNCQIGVKIPINSTNAREVNDARLSNNIGLTIGVLTSTLSVVGGVASGNPLAVVGGALSGGKTITDYVQKQNTNYQRASGSVASGQSGLYLPQKVRMRITRVKPIDMVEYTYRSLYGKPLNELRRLSNLKGFTKVKEIHLEGINATKEEIDEIETNLKDGVII